MYQRLQQVSLVLISRDRERQAHYSDNSVICTKRISYSPLMRLLKTHTRRNKPEQLIPNILLNSLPLAIIPSARHSLTLVVVFLLMSLMHMTHMMLVMMHMILLMMLVSVRMPTCCDTLVLHPTVHSLWWMSGLSSGVCIRN